MTGQDAEERPVWINAHAMMAKGKEQSERSTGVDHLIAKALAMDIVMAFCAGGQPIDVSNDDAFVRRHRKIWRKKPLTVSEWRRVKSLVKEYFVEARPGLWAPSPEFFLYNDPENEQL
jgi:hypothetical protein